MRRRSHGPSVADTQAIKLHDYGLTMLLLIVFQLFMVLTALGVIVTGLRAIRADIQRLINVQKGPSDQ